jgi:hypothetical protein
VLAGGHLFWGDNCNARAGHFGTRSLQTAAKVFKNLLDCSGQNSFSLGFLLCRQEYSLLAVDTASNGTDFVLAIALLVANLAGAELLVLPA